MIEEEDPSGNVITRRCAGILRNLKVVKEVGYKRTVEHTPYFECDTCGCLRFDKGVILLKKKNELAKANNFCSSRTAPGQMTI